MNFDTRNATTFFRVIHFILPLISCAHSPEMVTLKCINYAWGKLKKIPFPRKIRAKRNRRRSKKKMWKLLQKRKHERDPYHDYHFGDNTTRD